MRRWFSTTERLEHMIPLVLSVLVPYGTIVILMSGAPFTPRGIQGGQTAGPCAVEVRKIATLGQLDDPISVQVSMEAYVAEAPWGGWLVAEDAEDVIEYASNGDFRRTLGRRGQGPGELHQPSAVAVDPTDSTWVSDARGRVVVFGPDGRPSRTIQTPDLYQIEGFTESGEPFAMLSKVDRSDGVPRARRYIQIWDREGVPSGQLGPGGFAPRTEGIVVNEARALQGVVLGDTLGVVPKDWEGWMTFWSTSREWVAVPADSVWRVQGLDDPPESHSDGRPVAVTSDGSNGFWVLGVVRRLPEDEERALVSSIEPPPGETEDLFKRESAPVSNAVYDGALLHVGPDGSITAGTVFEHYPRGFASPNQFYTFTETDFRLIQIHIWAFERTCP